MRLFIRGLALVVFGAVTATTAAAQSREISFIRDAEIENTIRSYSVPLFAAAGLDPSAVKVYLINDPTLNAFVAGGQRIFINTGLLMASDSANQVIGVIAHETGHISGGHLARAHEAMSGASAAAIVATVLGAAAIVAGQGDAGQGIILGGQQLAQRTFLKYSRTQEASADQAALTVLDRTQQSARGLAEFLEKLSGQEALLSANQDPYVRTHPMSQDRIEAVRAHIARSPYSDKPEPPEFVIAHARMKAKLHGFLDDPAAVLQRIPESDTSIPARYARAIALFRERDVDAALAVMDGLLAEKPRDPYFHELKGQILLESGRVAESVAPYQEAVRLLPDQPLLRTALGQAQVSTEDDSYLGAAIENLQMAVREDPQQGSAWRWLAMAYGRDGQTGPAALATAERYMLNGQFRDAAQQADRATRMLPAGSPGHLRAEDIKIAAERQLDE